MVSISLSLSVCATSTPLSRIDRGRGVLLYTSWINDNATMRYYLFYPRDLRGGYRLRQLKNVVQEVPFIIMDGFDFNLFHFKHLLDFLPYHCYNQGGPG